jgi:guanylate kinase
MDSKHDTIVICGPSGAGKGTLLNMLLMKYPDKFGFSISHTTRKPRVNEKQGREYHFVSHEKMMESIQCNQLLEFAFVHENVYGTSFDAINNVNIQNKICILDLDIQGAKTMKKQEKFSPLYIFIEAPTIEDLRKRLIHRGTESNEEIDTRMKNAVCDSKKAHSSDLFDIFIVNDDLQETFETLDHFIQARFV